ncbi:hypothetical protein HELRODRAFT_169140 [Helobdella robusta]|uniref:Uncharacterized protein n=1 Tax=Helobdella robusta TaxID=6412 RepID=T1F1G4_HELRO|nr:hypothetical protein HELRODRAFT_169140 [Helobdella robusta]ESO08330.1 hypothetical protein HELRODRAFT_169140 [Helobdella robusta]
MEQAIKVVDKAILDSKVAQCQLAAFLQQSNTQKKPVAHTTTSNNLRTNSFGSIPTLNKSCQQENHYKSLQGLKVYEQNNRHSFSQPNEAMLKVINMVTPIQNNELVQFLENSQTNSRRMTLPSHYYLNRKNLQTENNVAYFTVGNVDNKKITEKKVLNWENDSDTIKRSLYKSNVLSLPDISFVNKLKTNVLPKSEAIIISQKIRDDRRRMKDLEQKLRKKAIIIKFGEITLIFTTSKFILTKSIFPYIYNKEH